MILLACGRWGSAFDCSQVEDLVHRFWDRIGRVMLESSRLRNLKVFVKDILNTFPSLEET